MFMQAAPGITDADVEGVLTGTSKTVDLRGRTFPATAYIASTASSRAVRYSHDGATWNDASYDTVSASGLGVAFMAPVAFVQFTGQAGDTWSMH